MEPNQDTILEPGKLGIDAKSTLNFAATGDGVASAFKSASAATTTWRVGGRINPFTDDTGHSGPGSATGGFAE